MKSMYNFILTSSFLLFHSLEDYALIPTYNLRSIIFVNVNINHPNDAKELEIYMEDTNTPAIFEYSVNIHNEIPVIYSFYPE